MSKLMRDIDQHDIVFGVGRTGVHVLDELLAMGEKIVAIDERPGVLENMPENQVLTLCGDATDDEGSLSRLVLGGRGVSLRRWTTTKRTCSLW